ncbi:hypothetical protein QBC43DRAFT_338012 [Cladorrhinum sp. PSN259]|nr:hypothetical protein QBC43DRAFT_338012 [Cladorrhinum sp. PSN259]
MPCIAHQLIPNKVRVSKCIRHINRNGTVGTSDALPRPISICATGIKATLKRVTFVYNATASSAAPGNPLSLSGLGVQSIANIDYKREEGKPLWAVENPGVEFDLVSIDLQWGIIDQATDQKFAGGIRTLRADSLALPTSMSSYGMSGSGWGDSLAGFRAPALSLQAIFTGNSYQGGTDLATMLRWQNLSSTPHKITNLRWTELMANMVTGTKSRLSGAVNAGAATSEVLMYRKTVTYRYGFGIAAYLCCGVWLAWAGACLYILCLPRLRGRVMPGSLRVAINHLSVGRLLVWRRNGAAGRDLALDMPTKDWWRKEGTTVVDLSKSPGGEDGDVEMELLQEESSNRDTWQ